MKFEVCIAPFPPGWNLFVRVDNQPAPEDIGIPMIVMDAPVMADKVWRRCTVQEWTHVLGVLNAIGAVVGVSDQGRKALGEIIPANPITAAEHVMFTWVCP